MVSVMARADRLAYETTTTTTTINSLATATATTTTTTMTTCAGTRTHLEHDDHYDHDDDEHHHCHRHHQHHHQQQQQHHHQRHHHCAAISSKTRTARRPPNAATVKATTCRSNCQLWIAFMLSSVILLMQTCAVETRSTDPATIAAPPTATTATAIVTATATAATAAAASAAAAAAAAAAAVTAMTAATATVTQTIPVAAPLLGNAATSGSLLNSTTALAAMRQKFSIESNSIQRQPNSSPNSGHAGGAAAHAGDYSRSLKRVALTNRTITCNDGSYAGFYWRKNPNSKKWIVFLEGGWHCYDTRSCRARWMRLRHLMTSAQWPETRDVGGILSPLPEENPYWHNANHVLVPYCSSDSWSGTHYVAKPRENEWSFMGALILRQVIADLVTYGLGRVSGSELLLVGSSAGGLGVMLNLDHITNYLVHERNLMVTVRGISDSGWFLDREPYTPAAVASSDAVRQGWKLWQGLLPEDCTKQHTTEPWRCYFGYRLYPTLKSPLFVFQWLFDEAQMRADNVGAPVTPEQWNYIHEMGGALRSSLDNVTAVFAPSCIGHAVLSKRDWVNIKIDDISLPAALRCWEHSTRHRRRRHDKLKRSTEATLTHDKRRHQKHRDDQLGNNHPKRNRNHRNLTKEERAERKRRRNEKQQQQQRRRECERERERNRKSHQHRVRNEGSVGGRSGNSSARGHESNNLPNSPVNDRRASNQRRNNHNNNNKKKVNPKKNGIGNSHSSSSSRNSSSNGLAATSPNAKKSRQGNKRRRKEQQQHARDQAHSQELLFQKEQPIAAEQQQMKRASANNASRQRHHNRVPRVPEKCALRLLERCSWPQCNHSCPSLTNPLTGEEMRFLELLTSFGLDIEAVAAALGVDMHTLNNMDRTELVNLLTQQVS